MRSPREIAFRLKQEAVNASRLVWIPRLRLEQPLEPTSVLPDRVACAELVAGTPYAGELLKIAGSVLRHRFPIFGQTIETGPDMDWRRDYRHARQSGLAFFRRVPYLDFDVVGDHKWIWELNRLQHLVVLAQAFLLSGRGEFLREIERQIESWIAANPFTRGINWASALEIAFRALSWLWVDHLVGARMTPGTRVRMQQALWQHGRHLEANLSVYFSPNTHLLGEALALYAVGRMYPAMPGAVRFARIGAAIVEEQLRFQVNPDGSHFEQSTYYHVYALDMFLLYFLLAGRPERMKIKLRAMAQYLDALAGPSRRLLSVGDDDGGRLFYPYGDRDGFCRATLASCANVFPELGFEYCARDVHEQAAWWIGPEVRASASRIAPRPQLSVFADSGMVVLVSGAVQVLFDAGPFGRGGAGHSHADMLNVLVRRGEHALLFDPGTFTYVADRAARDWFRGTAAHNTIRIDGRDQADPIKPFRWDNKPRVRLNRCDEGFADAHCEYRGFTHRRRILLCRDAVLIVVDDVSGPEGHHMVEQFWNVADDATLLTSEPQASESAWRSDVYGSRVEMRQAVVRIRSGLPVRLAAALVLDGSEAPVEIRGSTVRVGNIEAEFPDAAPPIWRSTG